MGKLSGPVAALLFAAGVALPISANAAAIGGPGLRAAAVDAGYLRDISAGGHSHALPGGVVLVQYDDDDRPSGNYSRPYSGGGNQPYNGGGGNGTGAAIGLGIGIITNILRQQQMEKQQQQQQQMMRQQQYNNNQAQKRKYREELEHQHKFDIEKAKQEEKRQEELDDIKKQLNEERKARLYSPQPNTPAAAVDTDPYHDSVGDIVINVIPAPDSCPDNFQELRVGATVLYPRRTDFPADPSLCAGTTGKGCYLKVESTPATCGASRRVCVERCPTLPPAKVVDIRPPYVPPTPVPPAPVPPAYPPPPVACSGGNCAPPPVPCNGGNCAPQINRACTGGNCGQQYETIQKPIKQASLTDESHDYVEPNHPKPTKKASLTDESHDYVEPNHPKPTKQASLTDESHDYVEPEHPKPTKKASLTDESHDYVEPNHPKPTKKASLTDESHEYVEPEHPKPTKKASLTDESHEYVEPHHGPKPAAKTDIAIHSGGELDTAEPSDSHEIFISPVQCPNLNLSGCGQEYKRRTEEEEKRKKAEEEKQYAIDHPKVDSKGCTAQGGVPKFKLTGNSDYKQLMTCIANNCQPESDIRATSFHAPDQHYAVQLQSGAWLNVPRELATGAMAAVPEVGALISGVTKFLWKDKTPDALFEQMKSYVDSFGTKQRFDDLDGLLTGFRNDLKEYADHKVGLRKGIDLGTLVSSMNNHEKSFLDPNAPERALAYFVAFATLKLTVRREQLLHGKDYYGSDADQKTDWKYLNGDVKCFTKAAAAIKKAALKWRLDKIHRHDDQYPVHETDFMGDDLWSFTKTTNATDDFCAWNGPVHENRDGNQPDIGAADAETANRKAETERAFSEDLDAILAPLSHWASATGAAHSGSEAELSDSCPLQ
jgi:hypothetical protein